MLKGGYIYILTNNWKKVLYIGVTNDLKRRIAEHIVGATAGFTHNYNVDRLVYYEFYKDIEEAIQREKQLKNWHREWKKNLISQTNPTWRDLTPELEITNEYLQAIAQMYNITFIPQLETNKYW